MTVSPVLMHTQYPDFEPEYELQYPSLPDRGNRVSIAGSATFNGVLIAVEPIGAVSVDIAREVARQILEAAAWVDGEDGWHNCKRMNLGAWSLYLTTGGLVGDDRPVISLEQADDEYMTPTYARLLAQALVMAADAVEHNRPL